ncbi:guanine nucleotide-binding protein-like 1 [Melanerpes formicivorus]|uniref:guanine nucleotide-binding protein-like 1 n=1 Tax=Melanerpes formicivorus TaxID=211600 RepID=UPI00358F8BA5
MPRKRPFSAKRKKQQLRDRRDRKRGDLPAGPGPGGGSRSGSRDRGSDADEGEAAAAPPQRRHDPGRFRLQLGGPRAEALARRRRRAQQEVVEMLPEERPGAGSRTDLWARPGLPPEASLELRDAAGGAAAQGGRGLRSLPPAAGGEARGGADRGGQESSRRRRRAGGLAPFEHNLETWRQLWRVLEMSDLILLITDAAAPGSERAPGPG